MTNACSGAVNMCIEVLCDTGQNILIPSPGFGLYKCLCEARGIEVRLYRLMVSYFSVYYVHVAVWIWQSVFVVVASTAYEFYVWQDIPSACQYMYTTT